MTLIYVGVKVSVYELRQVHRREAPHKPRRAQQAAAEVDTIIVHPDSLLLRVGERIPIYTLVSVEARSRAGDRVSDFAPLWLIEDDQIALLDAGQLIGRTPGETRLIIRPFAGDPNVRVRPIQALVLIRVSP